MDISFIIVNYNTANDLKRCLTSILDNVNDISFEILVIDNNSTERDIEQLPAEFNNVKFHFRKINDGYGAGNNYAVKLAKGKYCMLLNPDIIVKNNCISLLLKYLSSNDEIGAVSPALYNSGHEIDYYYSLLPSFYSVLMVQLGLYNSAKGIKMNMYGFLDSNIKNGKPFFVEQAIGACIMIKKSIFDKIGGFDEAFFIYQEETDFEYRMQKNGWKVMIIPEAEALHEHHTSTGKIGSAFIKFHWFRSLIIYYIKNFNFYERNLLRLVMIIVLILRGIKYLFQYSTKYSLLRKNECSVLKLFLLNISPRKYVLNNRYKFGESCI